MRFTGQSAFGILVVMGSVFGWGGGSDRNGSSSGTLAAAASAVNAGGTGADGEIWVTAQTTEELAVSWSDCSLHDSGGVGRFREERCGVVGIADYLSLAEIAKSHTPSMVG